MSLTWTNGQETCLARMFVMHLFNLGHALVEHLPVDQGIKIVSGKPEMVHYIRLHLLLFSILQELCPQ